MSDVLLRATGIGHAYGQNAVLRDVALELRPGQLAIVVGPNGSGKTTLARIIAGLLVPASGSIELGDSRLHKLSRRQIAQRLALVPQDSFVPFPYSVGQMVALGRAPHLGAFGIEGDKDRRRVEQAIEEQNLRALVQRDYPTLSGGEKQRVLLARARAQDVPCLLLDEPTAHMDLGHRLRCFEWLRGWIDSGADERGSLVITHDLMLAARFADQLILLDRGAVVASGEPEAVLTAERIAAVYQVDARVDRDPDGHLRVTPAASL